MYQSHIEGNWKETQFVLDFMCLNLMKRHGERKYRLLWLNKVERSCSDDVADPFCSNIKYV